MKTVLITGATAGIGLEAATQIGSTGTHLVLRFGHSLDNLAEAAARVSDAGARRVDTLMCDSSSPAQVRELARSGAGQYDRIAVIINHADAVFATRTGDCPESS